MPILSLPETLLPAEKSKFEIGKGISHQYMVHLERNAFLHLWVEQLGVDVQIDISRVAAGASANLRRVDLRIGSQGVEEVWWVAPETALYKISITSLRGAGAYVLEAAQRTVASEEEELRSQAQDTASVAMMLGKQDAGIAAFTFARAAELWHQCGDTWQEALAWAEAGRTAESVDQPHAILWLSHAFELFRDLNQPRREAAVLRLRAQALKGSGQLNRALDDQRRVVNMAQLHQDLLGEARGRNDLAVLQLQHGDYEKALDNYRLAARLWHQTGSRKEAIARNGISEIYMRLVRMDEARAELNLALELDHQGSRSRTLMLIGWWHYLEGEPGVALDFYHAVAARNVHQPPSAGLLDRMGSAHAKLKEWGLARLRYLQALAILESAGPQLDLAHVLSNLAGLSLYTGDPSEGFSACDRALQIFHRFGDRDSESHALWVRAGLHRRLGDLGAAQQDLEAALSLLEDLRIAAGTPTSRAAFLAGRIQIYELYIQVLMELHEEEGDQGWNLRALNVSERSRARSLLDLLAEAGVDSGPEIDERLLNRQRRLVDEIVALDEIAATRQNVELRETAERVLEERLREREELLQQIRRAAEKDGRLNSPRPIEAEEIGELLDGDTLFLAYGFGSEHAFLWWIDSSGHLGSAPLAGVTQIESKAKGWYRLLSEPGRKWDWRKRAKRGEDLREVLLRPAAKPIRQSRRLVIVSDGALRYLPFAALPAMDEDSRNLIATHEIVYLSSASTLALMRRQTSQREPAPEPLLAIGDPVYDRRDMRFPSAVRNTASGESGRLKYSGREVQQIRAVADPDCEECELLGFKANLNDLLNTELSRYRILHFAAHSEIHRKSPALSAIRLSRFDSLGNPRENHLLRFYEIFELDLPAELVVLSACSTALSEPLPGEGLIDLGRAFHYAGTPRALMTLWDVQDESTSILMTRFYEGMFHYGEAPSAALRRAQLEMIADGDWQPYHWAAFVLHGEWQPFEVLDADD